MKIVNRLLLILHGLVGIGGMAGGLAAITNPQAPLGMSVDTLKYSPFSSYLIPGILLFGVIGLGNILCAASMLIKSKYQGYISSVFSWALVIWIIVQCIMLHVIVHLHVIFFTIGIVQAFLSIIILFNENLFPANIINNILIILEKKFPGNIVLRNIVKIEKEIRKNI